MAKKPATERTDKSRPASASIRPSAMRPLPGVADEMVDNNGAVRPVWQHFLGAPQPHGRRRNCTSASPAPTAICAMPASSTATMAARAVAERNWPISHIPVLIDEREWKTLSEGLVQRADLLEAIVADIYGDNRLVEEGFLPPALIAANPGIPAPAGRRQAGRRPLPAFPAPSRSAAGPTATGGCWPTARRRRPAPASRWKTASPPPAPFPISMPKPTSTGSPPSSAPSATRCRRMKQQPRRPHRRSDAGPRQRNLFRTRLYRPLSRLHAARGRGPDRRQRPGHGAHRRRPEADQRALAPPRFRLCRSAGTRTSTPISARPALVEALRAESRHASSMRSAPAFSKPARCSPSCRPSVATCWART